MQKFKSPGLSYIVNRAGWIVIFQDAGQACAKLIKKQAMASALPFCRPLKKVKQPGSMAMLFLFGIANQAFSD